MTISVLIADDQALVRAGFAALLDAHDGIRVAGQAANGAEAVALAARLDPDVILMDVRMPEVDGIEATRRILGPGYPAAHVPRILMLTTFDIDVRDGAVVLTIRRVGMRFGRLRIAAPSFLRPRIGLVERWDEQRERHHVNMTIDAPLLGRVYEYTGFFEYAIESETP